MKWAILAAQFSHWRRSPLQLITLIAGLALGTALWSGVQAINAEARASYAAAAAALDEADFAQITARSGGAIAQDDYITLRRAGWLVSPVIEGDVQGIVLLGIDPLTAPRGFGPQVLGQDPNTGADLKTFIAGNGQIFAGKAARDALAGAAAGSVAGSGAEVILTTDMAPNTAITDIGTAQRILARAGQIDRLILAPDQPLGRPPLADIAPHLVQSAPQTGTDVARLTDSFHLNLTAFGLLSFAVGLFIVHGAIGLAFEQRRVMVRSLRACGAPLAWVIGLMLAELMALALVAGAIGVALGYLIAAALLPDVSASLRGLYGAQIDGALSLRAAWLLPSLGMAVGGALIAGGGALRSLAKMPLLASAQPRAWAMAQGIRAQRRAIWGALALLGLAGVLAVWGAGLIAGFAMLAALLIGGALALPPLLHGALNLAERQARGPMAQWFWADTRQQLPSLSLALMALMLAMAANVGVSTMVSSFRLTFVGFLDQRLASEMYVSAADSPQAARIADVGARHADAVLPVVFASITVAGQPAEVYGILDHATYRDNWALLLADAAPWQTLAAGGGVLINEQLYRRARLGLGDMVQIAPGRALPVLGVYGDYGNPIGQVIVGMDAFQAAHPKQIALRFGLRVTDAQADQLRTALRDQAGVASSAIIDQAALKAMSLNVFERTFTVTTALNVLTLAVAGFAMLMSLLTLAAMRLPQLAPVWALGATRARLGWLDVLRALVLAAGTGALALPLGLALAWALLAVVNVEAFGWRLPMYLFWADYLRLGVLALLAALLAAAWPAWRLSTLPPAQLLGVFRHER